MNFFTVLLPLYLVSTHFVYTESKSIYKEVIESSHDNNSSHRLDTTMHVRTDTDVNKIHHSRDAPTDVNESHYLRNAPQVDVPSLPNQSGKNSKHFISHFIFIKILLCC